MDPTTPNDLAFFYLYSYTTPSTPPKRSHHRHSSSEPPSSPEHHLESATTRRVQSLEAKRTRLANYHANIRSVLAQMSETEEVSVEKRLEMLLDRMARADGNRAAILRGLAENCGKRVEEAKIRAKRVKKRRDEEAKIARGGIVERLERAEKRRVE